MWSPNVVFGGLGLFLTLSVSREWRIAPVAKILEFLRRIHRRAEASTETT
jgi:hypothetical protein